MPPDSKQTLHLLGFPNVGKSSLINVLAKGDLRTGNWPGVTVGKAEAVIRQEGYQLRLIDLPGVESLAPSDRPDEQITLTELQSIQYKLLNVVDSTELDTQLPLTLELIARGHCVGVYLTRLDQFRRRGGQLDLSALSQALGIPVWGEEQVNRQELLRELANWSESPSTLPPRTTVSSVLKRSGYIKPAADSLSGRIDRVALHPQWGLLLFVLVFYLLFKLTFDLSIPLVDWTDGFVNDFLGQGVMSWLLAAHVPTVIRSLIGEGIIPGVGLVLSFLPLLAILYLLLGILEQSGYLMRVNRLFSRHLLRLGLPSASLIPLLLGFGCNVPAVYALRIIPAEADRRRTAALLPFISCGAKLPIYLFFAAIFFPNHGALVIGSLYLIGIAVLLLWARLLGAKSPLPSPPASALSALPAYHRPAWRTLWQTTRLKMSSFLTDAGTVIALSMVVIWALTHLPTGVGLESSVLAEAARLVSPLFAPLGLGDDWRPVAALVPGFVAKEVVIGTLGQLYAAAPDVATVMAPNWWAMLSEQALGLMVAIGQSVSNVFGAWYPLSLTAEVEVFAYDRLRETFTPLTAYVFMLFNLLLISCFAHMGAIRQEFGSRFMLQTVARTMLTAYFSALLVYQVGRLFIR